MFLSETIVKSFLKRKILFALTNFEITFFRLFLNCAHKVTNHTNKSDFIYQFDIRFHITFILVDQHLNTLKIS